MPGGTKPIDEIAVGDAVTTSGADGAGSRGIVVKVLKTRDRTVVVTTTMGHLMTTESQPFCLADGSVRSASELKKVVKVFGWFEGKRSEAKVEEVKSTGRTEVVFGLVFAEPVDFVVNHQLLRSGPAAVKPRIVE